MKLAKDLASQTQLTVKVNDKDQLIDPNSSVQDLLIKLNLGPAVAVEVNGCLVTKENHSTFKLTESSRVEIVTLTGGG